MIDPWPPNFGGFDSWRTHDGTDPRTHDTGPCPSCGQENCDDKDCGRAGAEEARAEE